MATRAKARCVVTDWDRKLVDSLEGAPQLVRVRFQHSYSGELEGEGTLEHLMLLREDGSASFVGMERVVGSLAGREGSFVLRHSGAFEEGMARVTWTVVPGSGTGELRDLRGGGGFSSPHSTSYEVELYFDLDAAAPPAAASPA